MPPNPRTNPNQNPNPNPPGRLSGCSPTLKLTLTLTETPTLTGGNFSWGAIVRIAKWSMVHLNLFICCKTELKIKSTFYIMRLFYRMNFIQSEFFLTELNFLKGDTNIYLKQIPLFEKKDFVKIIHISFLKIYFFNLVLLHLNNHSNLHLTYILL